MEAAGLPVTAGLLEPFAAGLGYQDLIPLTAPGAGSNLSFPVEGRSWIRILGAIATITTDANVANRVPSLDYLTARGNVYFRNFPPLVVTAGTAATVFHWQSGLGQSQWAGNTPVKVDLRALFLPPGTIVRLTLDNIQAGDTITAPLLYVERFDTGPLGYSVGFTPQPPDALEAQLAGQSQDAIQGAFPNVPGLTE